MKRRLFKFFVRTFFRGVAKEDFIKRLKEIKTLSYDYEGIPEIDHSTSIGNNVKHIIEKNGNVRLDCLKF